MKNLYGLIVLVVGVGFGSTFFIKSEAASGYSLSELQGIAKAANKVLPVMLDDQTKLEKISAHNKVLEKHFVMINYKASDLNIAAFKSKMTKIIKATSCANSKSVKLYQKGISEWFTYRGKDRKLITTIKMNSKKC